MSNSLKNTGFITVPTAVS